MSIPVGSLDVLRRSRLGLLTTYRRTGEPVTTPVSIAVRAGGVYFVTPATSGKARRLTADPHVTLAPSTLSGRVTGPSTEGRADLLDKVGQRRAARLLRPGGPLFWSYLLYRIRGRRMHVYEVRLTEPPSVHSRDTARATSTAQVYRAVQLTARSSALLFAAAQATSALGPRAGRAPRLLYLAFMAAHAVHFAVVARYAVVNNGRDLFPGGRSLHDVGGWPTVAGIYTFFAGLADHRLDRRRSPSGRSAYAARRRKGGHGAHGRDVRRGVSRTAPTVTVVRAALDRCGGGRDRKVPGPARTSGTGTRVASGWCAT